MDVAERDDIAGMLAEGLPADVVAARLIVPLTDVLEVQQQLRAVSHPRPDLTVARQQPARPRLRAVPSPSEPAMTVPTTPVPVPMAPPIAETQPDVFARAEAIDNPRVAQALTAAQEARSRLIRLVEEFESTAASRRRIVELEAELATERAKLRPAKKADTRPPSDVAVTARDVRAWADSNGVHVPDKGRVPKAVVEQYLAAQATR